MKKLIICLLLLIPVVAFAEETPEETYIFNFRNGITWGMKQAEVVSLEREYHTTHRNNYSYIINTGYVNGLYTTRGYFSTLNDKLAQITETYDNRETGVRPETHFENYYAVRGRLMNIYGTPHKNQTIWSVDTETRRKYALDEPGALMQGYLELVTTWELDDTDILLNMRLQQRTVKIIVAYQSKEYIDQYFKEDNIRMKEGVGF